MELLYSLFVESRLMEDLVDKRVDLFSPLFLAMIAITFLGFVVFYYVLNNKLVTRANKFANNSYWLLVFSITLVIVFLSHFITCTRWSGKHLARNPEADDPSITYFFDESYLAFSKFALGATLISALLFYLLSLFFKFRSDHAKNILPPF